MSDKRNGYAVWKTDSGGLVRRVGERFEFVAPPRISGYKVGDFMPDHWEIYPNNALAIQESKRLQFSH